MDTIIFNSLNIVNIICPDSPMSVLARSEILAMFVVL